MAQQTRKEKKIAIIGAGMGGLCAAVALRRRGFDVAVYERASQLGEVGAGLQLGPNCFRVFDALGLGDALRAAAFEPASMIQINWDDASLRFREPMKGPMREKFGAPYLTAHRGDLHRMFRENLPDGTVRLGKLCTGATTENGIAVAHFADGETIEADAVIAADGIRSIIRSQHFGTDKPRWTEQMAWRAIVPIACVPKAFGPGKATRLEPDDYFSWLGPNGHVICYPIGDGSMLNLFIGHVANEWVEESWSAPATREEIIAAHAGWNETLLDLFGKIEHVFKWGIFDRDPIPEWRHGRIVLLGDAAHPTMPTLAQGANMAIEDGYILGRCLDAHRDDIDAGLAAFVAVRQPRTARITAQSRQQFANNRKVPAPPQLSRDWIFEYDVARA